MAFGFFKKREYADIIFLSNVVDATPEEMTEAKEIICKHSRSFGGSLDDSDVMKLCGISRNSYYKYKKELLIQTNDVA
jgi:ACT domain-containing protein